MPLLQALNGYDLEEKEEIETASIEDSSQSPVQLK